MEDELTFINNCEAVTSASFKGNNHCDVNTNERKIYIYDVFRDQDFYTSDVELKFLFKNPIFNLWY